MSATRAGDWIPTRESEALARLFHDTYERLAPTFGYETRQESAVPWVDVPSANRELMIAVVSEVRARLQVSEPPVEFVVIGNQNDMRWVYSRAPSDLNTTQKAQRAAERTTCSTLSTYYTVHPIGPALPSPGEEG